MIEPLWRDRCQAGEALAHRCRDLAAWPRTLVLGLPRGGVVVAAALARDLGLPLASWSVRKLADPQAPELAIGAVAPGGVVLWGAPRRDPLDRGAQELLAQQCRELQRRQACYGDPHPGSLRGAHLVVVDDGVATGLTARAALQSLRRLEPASLTLAVPVMDAELRGEFAPLVERLEVLALVERLEAVGLWYGVFPQVEDEEVLALLRASRSPWPAGPFRPLRPAAAEARAPDQLS